MLTLLSATLHRSKYLMSTQLSLSPSGKKEEKKEVSDKPALFQHSESQMSQSGKGCLRVP